MKNKVLSILNLVFIFLISSYLEASSQEIQLHIEYAPRETQTISAERCRQLHRQHRIEDAGVCASASGLDILTRSANRYFECVEGMDYIGLGNPTWFCGNRERLDAADTSEERFCIKSAFNYEKSALLQAQLRNCIPTIQRFLRANREICEAKFRRILHFMPQEAEYYCGDISRGVGFLHRDYETCYETFPWGISSYEFRLMYCGRNRSGVADYRSSRFTSCMQDQFSRPETEDIFHIPESQQIDVVRRMHAQCQSQIKTGNCSR